MKIAILTSGRLPVPATNGGAVETILGFMLDYNEVHHLHDITVYSVAPEGRMPVSNGVNRYKYFSLTSFWEKIGRKIYKSLNANPYYDESIEYFLYKCIKDIRKESYDCVILENRPGYALKLSKATSSMILLHVHNDYLNVNTDRAVQIKDACSLVFTCSDFLSGRTTAITSKKHVPVMTLYNAIDVRRFVEAKPVDRRTLGLKDDDFVIFFSGRLTREKGILELIRAVKKLDDVKNLKLIVAGASFYGKDVSESPYMVELKKEAETVREKVIFTGYVDYRKMPSYLKTADIAVVPSLWEEPFGLTVLEAMASGVPLITTRSGGIPEICEGVAILLDRDDICHHLAEAIRFLYNHPVEAKVLSQKAQTRSWDFDKDVFSRNYMSILEMIQK